MYNCYQFKLTKLNNNREVLRQIMNDMTICFSKCVIYININSVTHLNCV